MFQNSQMKKYKKAPQAPRRFKSSYMFFSTEKHKSIRRDLTKNGENNNVSTTDVAKMVSQAWKDLSNEEREVWEELARKDKARYEMEKSMYSGPWKVPAKKRRAQKDPNAPKRPMSAFLSFSNAKRSEVKDNNPNMGTAQIARVLAQMWKDASHAEKKKHIDNEFRLRQEYKVAIAEWRRTSELAFQEVRKAREDQAMKAVLEGRPVPTNQVDCQHDNFQKKNSSKLSSSRPFSSSNDCCPPPAGYYYYPSREYHHHDVHPMAYGHPPPHPVFPQISAPYYYYGSSDGNSYHHDRGGGAETGHHHRTPLPTTTSQHIHHHQHPGPPLHTSSSWSNNISSTSAGGFLERTGDQRYVLCEDYSASNTTNAANNGGGYYTGDSFSCDHLPLAESTRYSCDQFYRPHSNGPSPYFYGHQYQHENHQHYCQHHEMNAFDASSTTTTSNSWWYDSTTPSQPPCEDSTNGSNTLVDDTTRRRKIATKTNNATFEPPNDFIGGGQQEQKESPSPQTPRLSQGY